MNTSKKTLKRVFGSLVLVGTGGVIWGINLPGTDLPPIAAAALPLALWALLMYLSVVGDDDQGEKLQDFTLVWTSSPSFRAINILFGLLMCLSMYIGAAIAPPPPHAGPYIIGMFGSMVIIFILNSFYLKSALKRGIPDESDHWSTGEKRLENVSTLASILLYIVGYPILRFFLPGHIEELYFALLFSLAGLGFGYAAHWFYAGRFSGFFDKTERKTQVVINIYLISLILTLCAAAFLNYRTARENTEPRRYRLDNKSESHRNNYVWLDIDGASKRFEPRLDAFKQAQAGDTMNVVVGKGCLGFEVILQFGVADTLPAR